MAEVTQIDLDWLIQACRDAGLDPLVTRDDPPEAPPYIEMAHNGKRLTIFVGYDEDEQRWVQDAMWSWVGKGGRYGDSGELSGPEDAKERIAWIKEKR